MLTSSLVGLEWGRGLGAGPRILGLVVLLIGGATGCGLLPQDGDCGQVLSTGECDAVRSQLGALDRRPPPDPTNRFGRCVADNSAECVAEDAAAALGKRLFFDRCLSMANDTACVTCHQPHQAFTDDRIRPILGPAMTVNIGGIDRNMPLPLVKNVNGDAVTGATLTQGPPLVQAQLDDNGAPLAYFGSDGSGGNQWTAVQRRPAVSTGTSGNRETARHSPTLYNLAYGAGVAPLHGERTYGVTWLPWDGRYDSAWAMVADVWEFGGTQNTDRAHIAVRVGQKHRAAYEHMIGGTLPNFDEKVPAMTGKYIYLRHGSPTFSPCWYSGKDSDCPTTTLAPTDKVRADINDVFVNSGKALAAYMRRLRSTSSPYDKWFAGDSTAMTAAAQRGLRLFIGKAECVLCHNGPNFTDWRFHNLGVPIDDPELKTAGSVLPSPPDARNACFDGLGPDRVCPDPGRQAWQLRADGQCPQDAVTIGGRPVSCQRVDQPPLALKGDIAMDCRSTQSDASDKDAQCLPVSEINPTKCAYMTTGDCNNDPLCQWVDGKPPRCVARADSAELGQFKTPTLRNVALTFPYMHNGLLSNYGPAESGKTASDDATPHLTRVVEFYNAGGGKPDVGTLDPLIHPLHLQPPEIADLVEFLKALTDNSMATTMDPLTIIPDDLVDVQDCPDHG